METMKEAVGLRDRLEEAAGDLLDFIPDLPSPPPDKVFDPEHRHKVRICEHGLLGFYLVLYAPGTERGRWRLLFKDDVHGFLVQLGLEDSELYRDLEREREAQKLAKQAMYAESALVEEVEEDTAVACIVCGEVDDWDDLWVCADCGSSVHELCGADTEPSGGYDRDPEVNYFVCYKCIYGDEPIAESIDAKPFDWSPGQEPVSVTTDELGDLLGDLDSHPF